MAGLTTRAKKGTPRKFKIVKSPGYKKGGLIKNKKVRYLQEGGLTGTDDDVFGLGKEVKGLDTSESYFTDDSKYSQFGTGKDSNGEGIEQSKSTSGIVGIFEEIGGIGGTAIDMQSKKRQDERQLKLQEEIDKTKVDSTSKAALYRSLVERESTRTEGFEEALGSKDVQLYSGFKAIVGGKGLEFMSEMDAIKKSREDEVIRSRKAGESLTLLKESAVREAQERGEEDFRLLKDGGKVVGPGTAKSDDVKATISLESFIVPAENAKVAEQLREMFLNEKGTKKADLKSGNVPVKLSKGEHMFSPEEVSTLMSNGVNLDLLAPNADKKLVSGAGLKDGSNKKDGDKFKLSDIDLLDVLSTTQIATALSGIAGQEDRPEGALTPELLSEFESAKDLESEISFPIAQMLRDIEKDRRSLSVVTSGDRSFEIGKRFAASTKAQAEKQRVRERKSLVESTARDRFNLSKAGLTSGLARSIAVERRALFTDKLDAFNQDKEAWGDLLQAGIANVVGSQRSREFSRDLENIS